MSIHQVNFEGKNKVEVAIALLRACEPSEGYYGASSGGKDSEVIKHLSILAGAKADWHYCVSPIDPPQIYQFLRQEHSDIQWDYHARGFWNTVREKGLPTRKNRWCCEIIKEAGGLGRTLIVGNREEEGHIRKGQTCFGRHDKVDKVFVRPIFYWTQGEVWEYIHEYNLPSCSLYGDGFERLGCVGCPIANKRNRLIELDRFPKIANLWWRACDQIVTDRLARGNISKRGKPYKHQYKTGKELRDWWMKY